jgi:hypothetical protein
MLLVTVLRSVGHGRVEVTADGHGRVEVTADDAELLIDRMITDFDGDVALEIRIDLSGRFLSLTAATTLRSYFVEKGAHSTDSDVIVFPKSSVHFIRLIGVSGLGFGIAGPIIGCEQDGLAVMSGVEAMLKKVSYEIPHLKYAYLQTDNARCYHKKELTLGIPLLNAMSTGVEIYQASTAETQDGKTGSASSNEIEVLDGLMFYLAAS